MIIWIDAQMSPALARWLAERFAIEALHVKDLDLSKRPTPVYSMLQESQMPSS